MPDEIVWLTLNTNLISLNLQRNISLKQYNTFGIDVMAKYFVSISTTAALIRLLKNPPIMGLDFFVLGGGSNLLFTRDLDALVIHINTKGIDVVDEDEHTVMVNVAAGENWHAFVLWALEQQFGGIENLSLIPGNVGTAPIQNIGAYGVELKDVFLECEAVDIHNGTVKHFTHRDCKFGYRDSIFKHEAKGKYIITSVTFKLTKKNHRLHTGYGGIKNILQQRGLTTPSIKDISDAVIAIRSSKLPDPAVLGNSGSFFKNPVISNMHFKALKNEFPNMPSYAVPGTSKRVKIPAGWLIEQCGFKGKRTGHTGVHEKQALVLVNYGAASGKEVLDLARSIQDTVKQHFNILLETEVNVI